LVNALREDVKRWRDSRYKGATNVTRELLHYWWREDRHRRLFYWQLEAVETVIFLSEIRSGGKRVRFNPRFTDDNLTKLVDTPLEPELLPLTRYGCKMATGSGKTVVMAMLIAWTLCKRGRFPSDDRFPSGVLVVCPDYPDNYYAAFDLVPNQLRPLTQNGKVMVTNWHRFNPESEHVENGKTYVVVDKGPESPEAFARRVLSDLYDHSPIMVLNDEGHHCYRPAPQVDPNGLTREEAQWFQHEQEEARRWASGLDRINLASGIRMCVDMPATPFYIRGSGYPKASPSLG
jgi:type III restriction enzyme